MTPQRKRTKENNKRERTTRPVAIWLFTCAASVFLMAVIGAITRLTESGLSIVNWQPIMGALPPLDPAAWQQAFDLYKETPQYLKVNTGMSLAAFKQIFFWEWLHRFWGRMIGVLYVLPLFFFYAQGRLPKESQGELLGVLVLGALQGGMGWYMVKSGLIDQPMVSHYRLAAHLILAAFIYIWLLRLAFAFGLSPEGDAGRLTMLRGLLKGTMALALLTVTWGALTAGLDAGLVYNSFPKMDGHWWPPELAQHPSFWRAFIEEPATVQFTHRVLAVLTLCKVVLCAFKSRYWHPPLRLRRLFSAIVFVVIGQVSLGIITLVNAVPLHAAVAHQAGAFVLLGLLAWLLHEIPETSGGE